MIEFEMSFFISLNRIVVFINFVLEYCI